MKSLSHCLGSPFAFTALGLVFVFPPSVSADVVSTAVGSGADTEMREQDDPTASRNTADDLNTRFNLSDRNEVVGLRFDLSGYTLSQFTNLTLNLINYRDNSARIIDVYGVTQGAFGGSGLYSTETWSDSGGSAVQAWGDLPGLLNSDGNVATASLDLANLTLLVDGANVGATEGTVDSVGSAALDAFVQGYTGSSSITLLIAAGNNSGGQYRFGSKEAASLTTIVGSAGDFAPYLDFEVTAPPAALTITNAALTMDGLVLSGTGGPSDGHFAVLATEDLLLPVTQWPAISTNTFDAAGQFVVTNPVLPAPSQQFFRLLTVTPEPPDGPGPIGFATLNGGVTGGAGGLTQTVSTAVAFGSAVGANDPRVIFVDGIIDINGLGTGNASINSDKTIIGLGTNSWVLGQLTISSENNVIIRNLNISNNGEPSTLDGVRIVDGSQNIWVDHCTFVDCSDGSVDITVASDYVTVSWCKFMYVSQTEHKFVNLIAASDDDAGDYRITFHNNWWSTGCNSRMPMSRYGTVHLFNNYYFAPGNSYCSNARTNAQFFSENNYFQQVNNPIYSDSNGRIKTSGNIYTNCTGQIDPGTNTLDAILSPPPYAYTPEATTNVPSIVTAGAGVGKGPFAP